MRIDLHTHSTESDGTDTPAELVRRAAHARVDVLAITDHDTTEGWAEAAAARPAASSLTCSGARSGAPSTVAVPPPHPPSARAAGTSAASP